MIVSAHKQRGLFGLWGAVFIISAALSIYTGQYEIIALPFLPLVFYLGWLYRNWVFYLLLFSLPFSIEYSFSDSLGTDFPDEMIMLFVTVLFFAYWIYNSGTTIVKPKLHLLLILLIAWLSWVAITVLCSGNQWISLKYLLSKTWYVGAFVLTPLIVFKDKRTIKIAAITLTTALLMVMFIVGVRHYSDDFSFASINEAVNPFFRNHVNYSAMLVCAVPVLLAFYQLSKKQGHKYFFVILVLVVIIALFFAYARGAWLALVVGLFGYWLIKKKLLVTTFIISIIVTTAALFWLKSGDRYLRYAPDFQTTIFHNNFNEHLVATYKLKDVSTAERFYRWIAGVRMIKQNALTGYGPNTFYDNYKSHAIPLYKTWVSDNEDRSTVHNYFLLLAIEQGIPGLIFFLVLLGVMLYYAQWLYHRIKDNFYKIVAITIGVMLVMITVLNSLSDLIETDKIGSLFFLCLAMLIVVDGNSRRIPGNLRIEKKNVQ